MNNRDDYDYLTRGLDKAKGVIEDSNDKENIGSSVNSFYGSGSSRPRTPLRTYSRKACPSTQPRLSDGFSKPFKFQVSSPKSPKPVSKPRRIASHLIGFPNAGLTCYFNAVLQALLGHSSFTNDLLQIKTKEGLVESLYEIAKCKEDGNQESANEAIRLFRHKLDVEMPRFNGLSMEDAHEFLVFFCDHLQTKCQSNESVSPISENFRYQLEGTLTCQQCKQVQIKEQEDFIMRLDMPQGTESEEFTMKNLLEKTLQESEVEVQCSQCSKAKIHKHRIKTLPRILILYLPRSLYFNNEKVFRKNRIQISVDIVLNLEDHVSPQVNKVKLSVPMSEVRRPVSRSESMDILSPIKSENSDLNDYSPISKLKSLKVKRTSSESSSLFDALSPPKVVKKDEQDVSSMSEEDQIKLAMEQSLKESQEMEKRREEEENRTLLKVLEASCSSANGDQKTSETVKEMKIRGKTEATEELEYQLTAVISHVNSIASVESGHYIADIYNAQLKQWFHYDDTRVSNRTLQTVIQQSSLDGCLFFYTHKDIVNFFNF